MSRCQLGIRFAVVACFLAGASIGCADDLNGVVVRFDNGATPAVQAEGKFRIRIGVEPDAARGAAAVHVDLPITGPNAWPVADVEVRDALGRAVPVRRSGIEWHQLRIPIPESPALFVQATESPETRARLPGEKERQFVDPASGASVAIARWFDGRAAALSLRFDDSHPTHLTKAIPLLREYGFRGTFMINPGADPPGGRRRSEFQAHRAEWEAVARAGDQELANHSAHHRGATDDADMEAEIGEAAEAIWSLAPGKSKLMALNLGGGTTWQTSRPLRYYLAKYHQFEIAGSLGMDDVYGQRVAALEKHLASHLERGLWCRVHFHSIGEGLAISEPHFRAALDAVARHKAELWIAGMADIHKYLTERSAASLARTSSDEHHLGLKVTCATDPELYDQLLTLEVRLPPSLPADRLTIRDARQKNLSGRLVRTGSETLVRFDVPPRTADYTLRWNP